MPRLTDVYPRRISSPRVVGMLRGGGLTTIWPGFTWYVDSIGGDDTKSGRSAAEAFQTIAALEAAGIAAWNQIGVAVNSHFDEQLDIAVDHVTVQAYGSGTAPLFDCSDRLVNANFAKTGGLVNVYDIAVAADLDAQTHINAWEDDVYLVRVANTAACDATPGSYYPSSDAVSPITLYVHASDSSDVRINGRAYDVSVRQQGIVITGNNCTINGIAARRNVHDDGSLKISGTDGLIVNCQADDGNTHNLFIGANGVVRNTTVTDAYAQGSNFSMVIGYVTIGTGVETILCDNVEVSLDSARPGTGASGFFFHTGAGVLATVTYQNCTATGLDYAFDGSADASQWNITDCVTSDCTTSVRTPMSTAVNGLVADHDGAGAARVISVTGAATVTLVNFHTTVSATNGAAVFTNQAATITITGSTLQTASVSGTVRGIQVANDSGSLTISSTKFGDNFNHYYYSSNAPTIASDNNCFNDGNTDMRIAGTNYADIAAYQVATGLDAHSTIGSCDLSAAP